MEKRQNLFNKYLLMFLYYLYIAHSYINNMLSFAAHLQHVRPSAKCFLKISFNPIQSGERDNIIISIYTWENLEKLGDSPKFI